MVTRPYVWNILQQDVSVINQSIWPTLQNLDGGFSCVRVVTVIWWEKVGRKNRRKRTSCRPLLKLNKGGVASLDLRMINWSMFHMYVFFIVNLSFHIVKYAVRNPLTLRFTSRKYQWYFKIDFYYINHFHTRLRIVETIWKHVMKSTQT
jgi:hypothetical protein